MNKVNQKRLHIFLHNRRSLYCEMVLLESVLGTAVKKEVNACTSSFQ